MPRSPKYRVEHAVAVVKSVDVYNVYPDHLGTPRVIESAATGAVVWRWDTSGPFGVDSPNENPSGAGAFTYNQRFPGQYYDRESNLHYNYYRDYDPQTGRYVESDPIGLKGGINTYGYVEGNPISFIDPRGLSKFDNFFGLPKDFWNWLHRADKGGRGYDYAEQEAKELYEEWIRQGRPRPDNKGRHRQGGYANPELLEWMLPWWLTPSESGCSDMSDRCKAERKRREQEMCEAKSD